MSSSQTGLLAALALSLLATGCPQATNDPAATPSTSSKAAEAGTLVVYCGRGEALVGPLFKEFEQETGISVSVRYGKTAALASQLLSEGAESPADVIFAQDSGYLGALAKQGFLAPLPKELLDKVDPRFRGEHWIGTSGRARVLVVSANVPDADLPASLKDLADPKWKGKLGWAPGNSSFQAHVSYLRHTWGEEETKAWLEAVQKNEPKVYPKNSPQVTAAIAGEIQLGWVNHYYLHRKGPNPGARNYSFKSAKDAGNVLMVAGLGIRAKSSNTSNARRLLEFLVRKSSQEYFARETFEYPTVPGIPTHTQVPALETLGLADVDQAHLADVGPTLKLLRELGLQ
ncbi:MAG: extracellular solute-binding protein [Planctomycetes bacterium]|nr:extracellular solute-binding protein [Planctomycetota bacterium]